MTSNRQHDHRWEAKKEAAVNRRDVSKRKLFYPEMGLSQKVFENLAAH